MKTKTIPAFTKMPRDYAGLCKLMLPRPIHDDVAYVTTVEIANVFAGFEDQMTEDQNDYFDLLCELIEKYDALSAKPLTLQALALLKHLASEHGITGAGLSRILGKSPSLGPMILRGERKLTAEHAICLGKYFRLRPDAFLG
ncbi:MAG: transcriptional regulator [Verrucomicrobiales bacterium VVV1]|nr:MAG: transcriptional regulator [Verrucomicrobiales bacterium VVV1]